MICSTACPFWRNNLSQEARCGGYFQQTGLHWFGVTESMKCFTEHEFTASHSPVCVLLLSPDCVCVLGFYFPVEQPLLEQICLAVEECEVNTHTHTYTQDTRLQIHIQIQLHAHASSQLQPYTHTHTATSKHTLTCV